VLVMTRPHAQWTLARLTDGNQSPPHLANVTFDSLEAGMGGVLVVCMTHLLRGTSIHRIF